MRSLHKVTCPSVRPHASYLNVILVVVWAGGGYYTRRIWFWFFSVHLIRTPHWT